METLYHKVDLETGERLDVLSFDPEIETVPNDCFSGWGNRVFFNPVYDFELNDWVEGYSVMDLVRLQIPHKVAELSEQCETVIKYGFYHNDDFFAFYDKDQMNFGQQLSLMLVDETIQVTLWKTENNGIKQFTRQQFIDICKAGERHKRENISRFWQLREYVTTHEFTSIEEFHRFNFGTEIKA